MDHLVARHQIAVELSVAMLGDALILAWPPVLPPAGGPAPEPEATDTANIRLTFTGPGSSIELGAAPVPVADAPVVAAAVDEATDDTRPTVDGPATTIQAQATVTPGVPIVRAPAVASWKLSLSEDSALYSAVALGGVGPASTETAGADPGVGSSAVPAVPASMAGTTKAPPKAAPRWRRARRSLHRSSASGCTTAASCCRSALERPALRPARRDRSPAGVSASPGCRSAPPPSDRRPRRDPRRPHARDRTRRRSAVPGRSRLRTV